jgi:two-component system, cell cycle sensor histidine kinase and response regulator CckA
VRHALANRCSRSASPSPQLRSSGTRTYGLAHAWTAFSVYLPQTSERVDAPPEGSSGRGAGAGGETILVVDDDAALLRLAVRMLGSTSYTVLSAASGEEALSLLVGYEGPMHLLLTDLVMPGMAGDELARRVKAQRPGIEVAYMTGYTDDEVLRRGVVTERVTLLNKPFTVEELQTTVRQVLDTER